jgi:hypothetical protein
MFASGSATPVNVYSGTSYANHHRRVHCFVEESLRLRRERDDEVHRTDRDEVKGVESR